MGPASLGPAWQDGADPGLQVSLCPCLPHFETSQHLLDRSLPDFVSNTQLKLGGAVGVTKDRQTKAQLPAWDDRQGSPSQSVPLLMLIMSQELETQERQGVRLENRRLRHPAGGECHPS